MKFLFSFRFDHNTSKNDFLSFQNIYSSMLLLNFVWIKRFIWRIDEQGKPSVDAMNIDQNFPDTGQISLMNAWLPLSPFSPRSPESRKKLRWNRLTKKNPSKVQTVNWANIHGELNFLRLCSCCLAKLQTLRFFSIEWI